MLNELFNSVIGGNVPSLTVVKEVAGVKHQGNGKFTGFIATKFADGHISVSDVIVNADTVYRAQAFAESQARG